MVARPRSVEIAGSTMRNCVTLNDRMKTKMAAIGEKENHDLGLKIR